MNEKIRESKILRLKNVRTAQERVVFHVSLKSPDRSNQLGKMSSLGSASIFERGEENSDFLALIESRAQDYHPGHPLRTLIAKFSFED